MSTSPPPLARSLRQFFFGLSVDSSRNDDDNDDNEKRGGRPTGGQTDSCLCIHVAETCNPQFGCYVWPSSVLLAEYMWQRRHQLSGRTVIELGCGTALPSLLAACCGATAIATDSSAQALANCTAACGANALPVTPATALFSAEPDALCHTGQVATMLLSWGRFTRDFAALPAVDVILAADCLYQTSIFDDFMCTVRQLMAQSPRAVLWCAYQNRSDARNLPLLCRKWGMAVTSRVPASSVLEHSLNADTPLPDVESISILTIALSPPSL